MDSRQKAASIAEYSRLIPWRENKQLPARARRG